MDLDKKSAYWTTSKYWVKATQLSSVQQNELYAIKQMLIDFPQDINIMADSAYVVGVIKHIFNAVTYSPKQVLFNLFKEIQALLQKRNAKIFITHIRSHSKLPGFLTFGNSQVDQLVMFLTPEQDHEKYHSNTGHLHVTYKIPYRRAKEIIKNCPVCRPLHLRVIPSGINPRGLQSNEIWQMDITHLPDSGKLKYLHVMVDTYSKFIWATAQSGEKTYNVILHLLETFAVMGIPSIIKTDNGPAYKSYKFKKFCEDYKIKHITGIEYNPQGQAIVERSNGILKLQIKKLKGRKKTDYSMDILSQFQNNIRALLHQALFIINFLNLPQGDILTRAEKHFVEDSTIINQEPIWMKLTKDRD